MNDNATGLARVGQFLRSIAEWVEERARVRVPERAYDQSAPGLARKIDEILTYLRDLERIRPPGRLDEDYLGQAGQELDALAVNVGMLSRRTPAATPPTKNAENKLQDPPIRLAKVTACFGVGGNAWTDYGTDGEFAGYCTANPYGKDATGEYIDTATTLYIQFPVLDGGIPGLLALMGQDATGVTYCPVGSVIPYIPVSQWPNGVYPGYGTQKMDGIEAGFVRRLPWILATGQGAPEYADPWGQSCAVMLAYVEPDTDTTTLTFMGRLVNIDPMGRIAAFGAEGQSAGQGNTISAWFDAADLGGGFSGHIPIHFVVAGYNGWTPPP